MAIARTVETFLREHQVPYEVLHHSHTSSSLRTAQEAHIPSDRLAKAVMLEDDQGYVMAVLPATRQINLGMLRYQLGRDVTLASEPEMADLFRDCEVGAIPPLGPAYGIETVCDDSLMTQPDIYFEGGDHEDLVHMSQDQFMRLLSMARRSHFCHLS